MFHLFFSAGAFLLFLFPELFVLLSSLQILGHGLTGRLFVHWRDETDVTADYYSLFIGLIISSMSTHGVAQLHFLLHNFKASLISSVKEFLRFLTFSFMYFIHFVGSCDILLSLTVWSGQTSTQPQPPTCRTRNKMQDIK